MFLKNSNKKKTKNEKKKKQRLRKKNFHFSIHFFIHKSKNDNGKVIKKSFEKNKIIFHNNSSVYSNHNQTLNK